MKVDTLGSTIHKKLGLRVKGLNANPSKTDPVGSIHNPASIAKEAWFRVEIALSTKEQIMAFISNPNILIPSFRKQTELELLAIRGVIMEWLQDIIKELDHD